MRRPAPGGKLAGMQDLAHRSPQHQESGSCEFVALRGGEQIAVSAVTPRDAPLLARGFAALSEESRRHRFLTPIERLDAAHLGYLTNIDHYDHEALGATTLTGEPVGVARYVRRVDDPEAADVAVAVVDSWQRKGVATTLLARLIARARENGIERFGAAVLAENTEAVELLISAGAAQAPDSSSGLLEFEFDLTDPDVAGGRAREILRHAALRLFSLAAQHRHTG